MCTVMGAAVGLQAVGTLTKGIAAKQQGAAAKAAFGRSADAAERAADDAVYRGTLKDMQLAMRASGIVAAQRVAQSASGVDVNIGAPRQVQVGTEAISAVDRATVRRNAALEAYGMRARAQELRQRGEYAEAEGDAAEVGTFLSGIGGFAVSAAKVGSDLKFDSPSLPEGGPGQGNG